MKCKVCGCTDERACETGCEWVGPNLCSNCIIYHDCRITEGMIVHELVHKLDKRLSEKSVREITEGLLYG